MKRLLVAVFAFSASLAQAQYLPDAYPVACDDNELVSQFNTVVHRFSFKSECNKALEEARTTAGRFCDGDKIFLPNGYEFHDFNWSSQCQEALGALRDSKAGLFCDGSAMYQIHLGQLFYHSFEAHCKEAVIQARDHRGLFCRDGVMFDQWGRALRDYGFRSSCIQALKNITSER